MKNITNYGIFVELSEGVGGMVHISDLSGLKRYAHPSEFTKVGSPLEVIVLTSIKTSARSAWATNRRKTTPGIRSSLCSPWVPTTRRR